MFLREVIPWWLAPIGYGGLAVLSTIFIPMVRLAPAPARLLLDPSAVWESPQKQGALACQAAQQRSKQAHNQPRPGTQGARTPCAYAHCTDPYYHTHCRCPPKPSFVRPPITFLPSTAAPNPAKHPQVYPPVKWFYVLVAYAVTPLFALPNSYGCGLTDWDMR